VICCLFPHAERGWLYRGDRGGAGRGGGERRGEEKNGKGRGCRGTRGRTEGGAERGGEMGERKEENMHIIHRRVRKGGDGRGRYPGWGKMYEEGDM
jgi:hypothetical protein